MMRKSRRKTPTMSSQTTVAWEPDHVWLNCRVQFHVHSVIIGQLIVLNAFQSLILIKACTQSLPDILSVHFPALHSHFLTNEALLWKQASVGSHVGGLIDNLPSLPSSICAADETPSFVPDTAPCLVNPHLLLLLLSTALLTFKIKTIHLLLASQHGSHVYWFPPPCTDLTQ